MAKATKRSGLAAQASASFSFWISMISPARSRSVSYQFGLMLSASMSMPCSSIMASRTPTAAMSRSSRRPGPPSFWPISASASGTAQWAWISTVLTRLPSITISRRRPGRDGGAEVEGLAAAVIAQST